MKSAEVSEFVDLSGKKNGVVIDWLEFTLFVRRPDALRDLSIYEFHRVMEKVEQLEGEELEMGAFLECCACPELAVRVYGGWLGDRERAGGGSEKYQFKTFTALEVSELLGDVGGDLERMAAGMNGYSSQYRTAAGVRILANGNADMGVHVIISGEIVQGIRDIQPFVARVLSEGGRFTRVDIAIDEHDKRLPLDKIIRKCKRGECSSRLKTWQLVEGGFISDGSSTGKTLYIGKRESDFMIRFYEQRAQLFYKGYPLKRLPKSWIRAEAECKGAAAVNVSRLLADPTTNVGDMAFEIINNYIGFKDKTSDKNKARWPLSAWWSDWLGGVHKLSVSRVLTPPNVERRTKWFARQCATSLAMLLDCHGVDYMHDVWRDGNNRKTEKQEREIQEFKRRKKRRSVQCKTIEKGACSEN